ncbi:MAG: hypothetical protein OH319_04720 [Candidatus Parvarchaeota archaeon]|nr:hypothetical protein [Candidatus Jingweiarchaeum tengchongense]MCW1298640.1 hypothetical protein [Candidatus Jingweiarchaeum tengchongense]MCW1300482.1 hypothetical protein [Candidatus Jingweiarchaeum tengchongense]MCW1304703.1 hypothetical protein [Candidatus Jingweiarchaeum tengchongense]MCW1305892.1 hypothetical protein [Candidatus Jingweiarchaeum tengchongense]
MSGFFKTKEERLEEKIQEWSELAREILKISDIGDLPVEVQELFLNAYRKHLQEIKNFPFFPIKRKDFECHLVAYIDAFLFAYRNGNLSNKQKT